MKKVNTCLFSNPGESEGRGVDSDVCGECLVDPPSQW